MIPATLLLDLAGADVQVGHETPNRNHLTHPLFELSSSGRYAADASIWSVVATMLATLDFNLARDADGNDIMFKATFTSGATEYVSVLVFLLLYMLNDSRHPNPFPCRLTPRPHVSKNFLDRALLK